jgi:hypothetical protein
MDIRLTKLEALIPTLATREDLLNTKIEMREDLLKTRGQLEVSIQKLETAMHSEMTKQTWTRIKWMTGLLVTLLPSLVAATFYIARYIH